MYNLGQGLVELKTRSMVKKTKIKHQMIKRQKVLTFFHFTTITKQVIQLIVIMFVGSDDALKKSII